MSVVSNVHTVVPFVSGKTVPMNGQRLAKVGYKNTAKNPAKYKNVAVSVPMISTESITENMDNLIPYIRTMLEKTQDNVIRSLYESNNGKLERVQDHEISVSACISFMEAESAGDRLKKEHIEAWFDRAAKENTFTLIAEKLGYSGDNLTAEQIETVDKHVATYRDILSMLAGGRTMLTPVQIRSCRVVIEVSEDESGIGNTLINRLDAMEKPAKIVECIDLG